MSHPPGVASVKLTILLDKGTVKLSLTQTVVNGEVKTTAVLSKDEAEGLAKSLWDYARELRASR